VSEPKRVVKESVPIRLFGLIERGAKDFSKEMTLVARWVERKGPCACCGPKCECCKEDTPETLFVTVTGATGDAEVFNGTHEVSLTGCEQTTSDVCIYNLELTGGFIDIRIHDVLGFYSCGVNLHLDGGDLGIYSNAGEGELCGELVELQFTEVIGNPAIWPSTILVSE
jgi:hypothetical protein